MTYAGVSLDRAAAETVDSHEYAKLMNGDNTGNHSEYRSDVDATSGVDAYKTPVNRRSIYEQLVKVHNGSASGIEQVTVADIEDIPLYLTLLSGE